jgi:hypothetical protein
MYILKQFFLKPFKLKLLIPKPFIIAFFILTGLALTEFIPAGLAQAHEGHHEGHHAEHHHQPGLAGHLSFHDKALHIHALFKTPPVLGKEADLVLETRAASDHHLVEIKDTLTVELSPPTGPQTSSAPALPRIEKATDTDGHTLTGVFNVRNVYFTTPGKWQVQVNLTDSSGKSESQNFKVNIVR